MFGEVVGAEQAGVLLHRTVEFLVSIDFDHAPVLTRKELQQQLHRTGKSLVTRVSPKAASLRTP